MAAMQKAVVTIGQDKIIRSVNREAIRLFGYQRAEELIGYVQPPPPRLPSSACPVLFQPRTSCLGTQ
jgi:PAS domain-containing protein